MKNDQYLWVHYVKAIAIFMVVLLHVAAPYHYQLNDIPIERWTVINFYDSVVRPCVPLFFMVSGFLLLRVDEPIINFIVKRLNRILVPLIFWTVAYILWRIYYAGQRYSDFGGIGQILLFPISYHLWYLYAILSCYLFLPLLRKITSGGNEAALAYYCGIWFFAVALLPLVVKYFKLKNQYDFGYATGYIGYFVLGYLMGKREYTKFHAILSVAVIVMCVAIIEYVTRVLTIANGNELVGDFTGVLSPTVIVESAAWFVLIKFLSGASLLKYSKKLNDIVVSISVCSFGIYLIHVIFINLIVGAFPAGFIELSSNLMLMIPAVSIAVFVASYLAVLLIGRVRVLRRTVGV
ncbi:acyltransferase [Pseudomonas chlororaphis]|uniref:acyltransferase n=1 Tax=Pseudomonas chlororaphis TaxID=587753 RepID=UPI000F54F0C8|nr:acyltransferase family protein [Pseudomonas chlororaphis]